MVAAPTGHSIGKYYKQNVYTPAKDKIGTIDDVIVSDDGQIQAFVIGVGGFLGMGEKDVIIDLDQLTQDGDHLKVNMTKEQIGALPDFDD